MTITEMRDAGLLRARITEVYGQVLTFGGSAPTYFHAMRLVRRLARLAGLSLATVMSDIQSDVLAVL